MAERDLNFNQTITNVVPKDAYSTAEGIAAVGAKIADASEQSKLLAATAQAHVAFKTLDAQFRLKYQDDPNNADGLKELQESRKTISDNLGEGISSLYQRQWNEKVTDLGANSDVANDVWAAQQNHVNTIGNTNGAMRTYIDMGNKDGMAFGASPSMDGSAAMNYLTARQHLEDFARPYLGAVKTQELLKNFNKDYMKSFLSGVAEKSPEKAVALLQNPEIVKEFTSEERGEFTDQISKTRKQQEMQKQISITVNNSQLTDLVNDPNMNYLQKRYKLDILDQQGAISTKAGAAARRVIKSSEDLDALTDGPTMTGIINQIYDLNATAQTSPSDYLRGVRNVQEMILEKQASGQLTAPDAGKLNKQLTELTSKRTADATQQAGNSFYEANQQFNILPPEYRGEATRQLFYAGDGKNLTNQQYAAQANVIIDGIQKKRRQEAMKTVAATSQGDADFLKGIKATPADVAATAQRYHISEAEVMRQLRGARSKKNPVRNTAPGASDSFTPAPLPEPAPEPDAEPDGADAE